MSGAVKRTVAVAALTWGVATIGLHSIHPPGDALSDSGRRTQLEQQYKHVQEQEERERRRLLRLHTDVEISEAQRAAEVRRAERHLDALDARKDALVLERKALESGGDDAARAAARRIAGRKP